MVLRMKVEEVEQIEVDLSAMIGLIRLRAKFNIAFFVSIEDVCGGSKGGEDLTELIVLIWLIEACCDLVHAWLWTSWRHVDP